MSDIQQTIEMNGITFRDLHDVSENLSVLAARLPAYLPEAAEISTSARAIAAILKFALRDDERRKEGKE